MNDTQVGHENSSHLLTNYLVNYLIVPREFINFSPT